jgi:hypothetical protein
VYEPSKIQYTVVLFPSTNYLNVETWSYKADFPDRFPKTVVPDQGAQLYAGRPESSGAYLESRDMGYILFYHACVSLNQTLYQ